MPAFPRVLPFVLSLALLVPERAVASTRGPESTGEEAAAFAVLAAYRSGDAVRLKALASREDPDPWLVADALMERGEVDAAEAFARAAPRADVERLPDYLASRRGRPRESEARARLRAAHEALRASSPDRILLSTIPPPSRHASVVEVRLTLARARALDVAGRRGEAGAEFEAAAGAAARMGWLAQQAAALGHAGMAAYRDIDAPRTLARWNERLDVEERRSSRTGAAEALHALALIHGALEDHRTALRCQERALRLREEVGDPAHVAKALVELGSSHALAGEREIAVQCGARALRLREDLRDAAGAAEAHSMLGLTHQFLDHHPEAIRCHRRALELYDALGDPASVANALGQIGFSLQSTGDHGQAVRCLEQAERLWETIGNPAEMATVLASRGHALSSLGDHAGALACHERALGLHRERGDRAAVARGLANVGDVLRERGDYREALGYEEQALRLFEDLQDTRALATILGSLGRTLEDMGDYDRALKCSERSLTLSEAIEDREGIAVALMNLGVLHERLGDYPMALRCQERALKIHEQRADREEVAKTLVNLGLVHISRGDHARALRSLEEALGIAEALGIRPVAARALLGMGATYHHRGDYARALDCHERALRLAEDTGERGMVATARGNIGNLYASLGATARAHEHLEQARSTFEAIGARDKTAVVLLSLGSLQSDAGEHGAALRRYERVLELAEEMGARPLVASALAMIGGARRALGDAAGAMEYLDRSRKLHHELGEVAGVAQVDVSRGRAYESLADYPRALETLAGARARAAEIGDTFAQQCALLALARLHRQQGSPGPSIALAREAVAGLPRLAGGMGHDLGMVARETWQEAFAVGALAAMDLGNADEAAFFLESGRAGALLEAFSTRSAISEDALPPDLRRAEIDARDQQTSRAAALRRAFAGSDLEAARRARAELDEATRALDAVVERIQRASARAASVTYPKADELATIQGRLGASEALVLYGLYEKEALALVVTREDARLVRLPEPARIRAACEALQLDDEAMDPTPAVAALRALVIDPLALPQGVHRLLVSPDATLCFVPFALLLPDREVACVPSGTVHGLLLEDRPKRGDGVLALGDPDYRSEPASALRAGPSLHRLPASREEAMAVGTVALLGRDATETRLRAEIAKRPRWRAVHLACHGFVDAENPQRSALAVAPDEGSDGLLTVLDVFRMSCPSDLVVLSACETGRGKVVRGEGLAGLTRAFMFAGAPRVLVSLWKVDDAATKALMTEFYGRWNAGASAAAALREAQARVRAMPGRRHPRHWAAWVLWGLPG